MTFEQYKATRDAIQAQISEVGNRLSQYPKGAMGLTLDEAKDAAWYADMKMLNALRTMAQRHNRGNLTRFAKELRSEAQARRAAKGWL